MDIPVANTLPDPYGSASQAAHPWRGRITCHPAEGLAGSSHGTAAAASQVAAFLGAASPSQFSHSGDVVSSSTPGTDWGYRRFIFHCAAMARAAGGVDAFLIGSELRGLTGIAANGGSHPFVQGLMAIAADVRAMLGAQTKLTYAADWTEYAGVRPKAAPGDIRYNLDPLWAHPAIDAVGIDWYPPLTDWRDEDAGGLSPDGASGPHDADAMHAGLTGGEGHDWHYADSNARAARMRTPITDGAFGKPWVWRVKALKAWWENHHHDRVGGNEAATPSPWVPRSKPIWLTEVGCPAVDKGANQPNVFPDPKSSENALPHFSSGARDDVQQRLFLEAHQRMFDAAHPAFAEAGNPATGLFSGRMVDASRCYAWAWDARPFPAFPLDAPTWGDGRNWLAGHWLNGRLGAVCVRDLIAAVFADHGLPAPRFGSVGGWLDGYAVSRPEAARDTLEAVLNLFGVIAAPDTATWHFRDIGALAGPPVLVGDVVADDDHGAVVHARAARTTVPNEAVLTVADPFANHEATSLRAHVATGDLARQTALSLPAALDGSSAQALVEQWLARARQEAASVRLGLPHTFAGLRPGDVIRLPGDAQPYRIEQVRTGEHLAIEARVHGESAPCARPPHLPPGPVGAPVVSGRPNMILLDLPESADGNRVQITVAAHATPWRRQAVTVLRGGRMLDAGLVEAPATLGILPDGAPSAASWRFTHGGFRVRLHSGALEAVTRRMVLDGANAAAIRSASGAWEVVQFAAAEEIAAGVWRIGDMLRGQSGTEDAALAGAQPGADFVLLDAALVRVDAAMDDVLNLRIGPASKPSDDPSWLDATHPRPARSLLPPAPVHLRWFPAGAGSGVLSWIRRGRIDADDWEPSDIPLGEDGERYGWRISTPSGSVVLNGGVAVPELALTAGKRAAALGAADAPFTFTVWQEGRLAGRGLASSLSVA
jgi:hypothetical protein